MSESNHFFAELPSFSQFEGFTNERHYRSLPDDWIIFLTDVKGSTKAIEAGRYKDVNLIGAATITVCIKALEGFDFPYVFGGDGATFCVPRKYEERINIELSKLRNLSKINFNLDLRVAKIPVSDVYQGKKENSRGQI